MTKLKYTIENVITVNTYEEAIKFADKNNIDRNRIKAKYIEIPDEEYFKMKDGHMPIKRRKAR